MICCHLVRDAPHCRTETSKIWNYENSVSEDEIAYICMIQEVA